MTSGSDKPDRVARLLQFGDSMFPIGGFSFSCGLESAVQTGVVKDRATLHEFARTALEQAARDAFVVHQYGVATAILGASLRLMRVSHVDTQAILYDLNERAEAAYETAAAARLCDMAGFAPLADILAAVHTKAHVRLFMN